MRKNVLPAIPITSLSARINLQLWLAVFFTGFTHCLPANPQAFMLTERHSSGLLSQSAVLRNHKELTAEGNRSQAQARKRVTQQGQQITLNGQQFLVAWQQWEEGNITHTGISDVGAREIFGLNLLTTHEVSVQPIAWFSSIMKLDAYLVSPYRYLDITDFARKAGWQLKVLGDTLIIQSSPAQIVDIQQERGQSQKITVYLDRPTVWQVDRARGTLTINIDGVASTLARFRSSQEDIAGLDSLPPSFTLNSDDSRTKLQFSFPVEQEVKVSSLAEPARLVVTTGSDSLEPKTISWAPGIRWHQQYIDITAPSKSSKRFPVIWLEVDLRSPQLTLKPITSNASARGTAPLITTAREQQAAAAINGGFFNRNNQLPLGAIRQDTLWLSGPILNRSAIAWNQQGQIKIARLSLQETLITSPGDKLSIGYLNSGYVQAGLARYTRNWGETYTPLTDNETIILVQNHRITQKLAAGLAGQNAYAIPSDGYLLTIRADGSPENRLAVGTEVKLESTTVPQDFAAYPYIVGAGPLLLQNRQVVLNAQAEQFSPAFAQQAASRSAIGVNEQGNLIIAAVHSGSNSKGPTLEELALVFLRLGAVDALNLDGGSSTSFYLGGYLIDRSPTTAARVHNGIGIFLR